MKKKNRKLAVAVYLRFKIGLIVEGKVHKVSKGRNREKLKGGVTGAKEVHTKLDTVYWEEEALLKYEMSGYLEVRWEKRESMQSSLKGMRDL